MILTLVSRTTRGFVLQPPTTPDRLLPLMKVRVDITLMDGSTVAGVEIATAEEAYKVAMGLEAAGKLDPGGARDLAKALAARLQQKDREPYEGPICQELNEVEATIFLEEPGIAFEVARSTIPESGRGLFIRKLPGREPFDFYEGDIVCGYAVGSTNHGMDRNDAKVCGTAVDFRWTGPTQRVIFDGILQRVGDLRNLGYEPAHDDALFVPDDPQPSFDILNIGHLANDLAWRPGASFTEYADRSRQGANVLGLVPRLQPASSSSSTGDDELPRLEFSRPIMVAHADFRVANDLPMELGVEYGWNYWQ